MQARTITCINNQKQLTLAWILYAEDHEGRLTPNRPYQGPFVPDGPTWVYGWLQHFSENWSDNTNTYYLETSLLALYLGPSIPLWKCPEDRSTGLFEGKRIPRVRSYSMSLYLDGDFGDLYEFKFRTYADMAQIRSPSQTFVLMDEREDTIQDSVFVVDTENEPAEMGNTPRTAHNGGGVLSFADGHVIRKKWLDLDKWPPFVSHVHGPIFATHPLRDLHWLRENTSVPK
jgi:prepilin-type processing-associated H-X9-DG protein